ncbi:ArnT family glycosyltransferase [Aquincola tertiaricarbonis]|uniref:ArnT family glycosyltransferase n=1 Tax=Aquincola tertiaricarbonis TaxID=391953 RepID=UPI0009FAAF2F|nr:glycosyltransferase family 39 protein [Aquincola tertiaricarbonis]
MTSSRDTHPLSGGATSTATVWTVYVLLALALVLLQWRVFVGYQASDDANYLLGAMGWLEHSPYVGNSHWTLRHTLTLPSALSISALGLNLFSVALPTLIYFIGFIAVQTWALHRHFGFQVAACFALIAMTTSGMVVNSTYLAPDVAELFFVGTTFWVLMAALEPRADGQRGTAWVWLLAGVLAGLAWSNRQTAAGALLACAITAWVAGRPARARMPWAVLGFALIVGAEWAYLTIMTGNPMYRIGLDMHHDPVNRLAEVQRVAARGGWIDKEGNLSVHLLLDPILALFVSQKYGLVFWTGVVAAWQAWRLPQGRDRRLLMRLMGLGAIAFVFVAANPKLYLVPRYLLVPAWVAIVLTAWWVARLWARQHRALAGCVVAAVVGMNLLCLSVENTQPRAIEQALVDWVAAHPQQRVHTDIETLERARGFFRIAGVSPETVSSAPAAAGNLVFYSAVRVEQCAAQVRCRDVAPAFRAQPGWVATETLVGPAKPVGRLLTALGIAQRLPPDIARRIVGPSYEVILYEVR